MPKDKPIASDICSNEFAQAQLPLGVILLTELSQSDVDQRKAFTNILYIPKVNKNAVELCILYIIKSLFI